MVDRHSAPGIPEPARWVATRSAPTGTRVDGIPLSRQETVDAAVWQALLDAADKAVVVHDGRRLVRVVSRRAAELFPELRPGVELAGVAGFTGSEQNEVEDDLPGRAMAVDSHPIGRRPRGLAG